MHITQVEKQNTAIKKEGSVNKKEPLKSPNLIRLELRVEEIPYPEEKREVASWLAEYEFLFCEVNTLPRNRFEALQQLYAKEGITVTHPGDLNESDWEAADLSYRKRALEIHFHAVQVITQYGKLAQAIYHSMKLLCEDIFGTVQPA